MRISVEPCQRVETALTKETMRSLITLGEIMRPEFERLLQNGYTLRDGMLVKERVIEY